MRQSLASLALIRREVNGSAGWLVQWNERWRKFNLIGGHKKKGESFQECMAREIQEELDLRDGTNCTVAPEPQSVLEYEAWSEGAREQTAYRMALFDVTLTDEAMECVDANPRNRWVGEEEIRRQACADGRPVSPTVLDLLTRMDWGKGVRG